MAVKVQFSDVRLNVNYIIMDLEWNNSYMKSTQKFINEIIEIGAVKLDKELKEIDTFSELIKPVVSRKLRSRIKNLTHITNDDIKTGRPFTKVISDFEKTYDKILLQQAEGKEIT